ncbi:MAG: hypothetical protein M3409_11880 [Gemmatimonadota bacterium]|jgi:hypothetical protein|nr:hypothetical protein [Gemmatimonadota bacterium]
MNLLKVLAAGAALTVIVFALRDPDTGEWLVPGQPPATGAELDEHEPVLGYDGMDRDTLVAWLRDADLDDGTLRRVRLYESRHQGRAMVLDTVDELMIF